MHEEAAAAHHLEFEIRLGKGAAFFRHQERKCKHGRFGVAVVAVHEDFAAAGTMEGGLEEGQERDDQSHRRLGRGWRGGE